VAPSKCLFRDVTEPANIRNGCVSASNPSDLDADTDLSRYQNYQLLWLL